jgi:hypothetical protein
MLALQEGSSLKKLATLTALSLLAMLIVLPTACSVNYSASNSLIAEGWPLPFPFPPGLHADSSLTAEGWPLPFPFPPVAHDNAFLTAEGWPLPFPFPPQNSLAV